jgi:hypothetical protein
VAQATTKQRVVDLDNEVLEVYMGAVSKGQAVSERFNSVGEMDDTVPALVKSFPFAQLTTEADFLVALKEDLGEEVTEDIIAWLYQHAGEGKEEVGVGGASGR